MQYARTTVASIDPSKDSVALRTSCAVLSVGGSSMLPLNHANGDHANGDQPQLTAKPALVTLHVVHGRLWSSNSASPQPAEQQQEHAHHAPARAPKSGFTLLCDLKGASLEAVLVPNGPFKQRLVLTLFAPDPLRKEPCSLVLFPKDRAHFIRIAGAITHHASRK
jgi:hypothetical protein